MFSCQWFKKRSSDFTSQIHGVIRLLISTLLLQRAFPQSLKLKASIYSDNVTNDALLLEFFLQKET